MAFPDGWARKCALTLDHTLVDADLSDWTYILTEDTLPSEMLNTSSGHACLDGGGDVRFSSDSAGSTRLACDIRACHPTAGGTGAYADIAVKVPSVSSSGDTTIYIWYEKSGETQPAPNDTYGQYNAYDSNTVAVYPLHEDPSGSAPQMKNRKADQYHGTSYNMVAEDSVAAAVYKGFNGDENNYIQTAVSKTVLGSEWSIEILLNSSAASTAWWGAYVIADTNEPGYPWLSLVQANATTLYYNIRDGYRLSHAITAGNWYHDAITYDGSKWSNYQNGVADETYTESLPSYNGSYLFIGSAYNTQWYGLLDELRASTIARSAAWLKADYYNLLDPTNLTTVGTPASTATLITVDMDGVVVNAKPVTIQAGSTISVTKGSVIVDSAPLTVLTGTDVFTTLGSVTVSGKPVSIAAGNNIAVDKGSVTCQAKPVNLNVETVVTVSCGQVVVVSSPVELYAATKIEVGKGTVEVSSYSLTISEGIVRGGLLLSSILTRPTLLGSVMINQSNRLWISEDNNIKISGLRLASDDSYVNDATATFTIRNSTGGVHSSITGISLAYSSGTNGVYLGVLPSTSAATLVEDAEYILEITAASSDKDLFRRQKLVAGYHPFEDV